MEELREYYYGKFYCEGMPKFEDLSPEQLKEIENTSFFAIYKACKKLDVAFQEIRKSIAKSFPQN